MLVYDIQMSKNNINNNNNKNNNYESNVAKNKKTLKYCRQKKNKKSNINFKHFILKKNEMCMLTDNFLHLI